MIPVGVINQQRGGIPVTPFWSHTWPVDPSGVNLSTRVGFRFTVGGSNLIVNQLGLYGYSLNLGYTQNVRIHRVSDGVLMTEANITQTSLGWNYQGVTEIALVAGLAYTCSYRNGGAGRPMLRNVANLTWYAGFTKTANVFGSSDALPTTTSSNVYIESGFGYV